MSKRNLTLTGCALALVLFFAVNIVANATMRSLRMDLTEDEVFTLDEGSKAIAKGIDEPINLYFYFSRNLARELPQVVEYADRVLGILREYERSSGGNIRLSVIDPEPFSEEEDLAVEQGIQGVPLPSGDQLYFGLVGTSSTDAREAIPFFALDEDKQRTLEYDLSKLIWTLAHPDKKKVGILSALPLEGGGGNPMLGQQGEPRWQILDQLGDFFDVEVLSTTAEELEEDLDILLVIHPRGFTDETLYLIDQWALAGKPLVVFVDPQCDVDPGESADPTNPMSRFTSKKDSELERLFKAWGFEMAKNKVVCDRDLGIVQAVRSRDGRGQQELPVIFWLRHGPDELSREDPVTRLLRNVMTLTAGSLRKLPEGTTTFTPILGTSEVAKEEDSSRFQFMPEPQELLASFVPGYEKLTLGARVTGTVQTAFPDGKPGAPNDGEPEEDVDEAAEDGASESGEEKKEGEEAAGTVGPVQGLTASTQPLNLIVFSDADMLHDRLWMQEGRFGNLRLITVVSDNLDLLKNALESVSGGQELMSIRVRGKTSRPFETVQEIRRESDQRYLARQQELERKLQDADQRLKELQKAKTEGSEELVTAAQREEEAKVREDLVQTRRDLRSVLHQRDREIKRLGTSLKWLNIALMPALVCAAAVALGAWRAQQRAKK